MVPVDRLKLHHLIELLPVGIQVGQAAEIHGSLSPEEREQFGRHARAEATRSKTDPDAYLDPQMHLSINAVRDPLLRLARLVPGSLQGLHLDVIDGGFFLPADLYRDAGTEVRDHLIGLVETPPHNLHVLVPLAWIGDEVVQQTFHRWRQHPSPWDPDLGSRIDEYVTPAAGWELTPAGGRRDLCHTQCYALVSPDTAPADERPGPVEVVAPHREQCGWCGQQLVTLFDIDLGAPQLSLFEDLPPNARLSFLAPGWSRLRIAMCDRCTLFGTVFTEVDGEGTSHWSDLNVRPEYIGTEKHGWHLPPRCLVLGSPRRSPYEAHFGVESRGASQISGFPTWVQGNSHPRCPKCGRWMVFIGQVETSDALGEPAEGVTYAFLCQDCGMAATAYEQT